MRKKTKHIKVKKNKNYPITYRYFIILFKNRKKYKLMHKSAKKTTIMRIWDELKTTKKPLYTQTNAGRSRNETIFELGLIFPKTRWNNKVYVKDSLGRQLEVKLNNDKQRLKTIIPFWKEELIYDSDKKERIRYDEMMDYILSIKDIAQIFTLNNKLIIQVENNIKIYRNKNLSDCDRLFDIVKSDLLRRKMNNFIFVKDISTHQRILLYDILEEKGYKRADLFKHYSY